VTQKVAVAGVPFKDRQMEQMRLAVNGLLRGRANVAGTFTLTASAGSTVVTDPEFAHDMVPLWIPTTANAAAEIGAGTMYLSARGAESFTVAHANNAQVDRTFLYIRFG